MLAGGAAWERDADSAMPGDARTATPIAVRITFRLVFIVNLTSGFCRPASES
jgi:hypothetical protein